MTPYLYKIKENIYYIQIIFKVVDQQFYHDCIYTMFIVYSNAIIVGTIKLTCLVQLEAKTDTIFRIENQLFFWQKGWSHQMFQN